MKLDIVGGVFVGGVLHGPLLSSGYNERYVWLEDETAYLQYCGMTRKTHIHPKTNDSYVLAEYLAWWDIST